MAVKRTGGDSRGGADFEITPDAKEFKDLNHWFDKAPGKMRRVIRKEWRKEGKTTIKAMRASHFSGPTGGSTIRKRPGRERQLPKGPRAFRSGKKRKRSPQMFIHVATALTVKKVKFSIKDSLGGYMILGFKGAKGEPKLAHFIAMMHEFGTPQMKARGPEAAAWAAQGGGVDLDNAASAAVDSVIRTFGD